MNPRVRDLLAEITTLEDSLRAALREQEVHMLYQFKGRRVEFESAIRASHRKLKRGLLRWVVMDRPRNLITGPLIYALIVPLLLMDFTVTVFQALCFPVYRMPKVQRANYFFYDRQHLEYLNFIERFHCTYCAYANGLLAYMVEVAARTEQYFCPIKHAHRILGAHARYERFIEYGDPADYHARLNEYRLALEKEMQS